MASQALNVVNLTIDDNDDDDDDDDLCVLYAKPVLRNKGSSLSNPISVESYSEDKALSLAIVASLSSQRRPKRVIDLSQDYFNCDHQEDDDVQVISSIPKRKVFKGESSNSKPTNDNGSLDDCVDAMDATFLCNICVDEKPRIELFCIKGCAHYYCNECMAKYVSSKLQENITSVTCPVVGCSGRLEPQDCRSILPSPVFDRWGDALCEAMILASEKFYCPYKDCSALLINDNLGGDESVTNSECPYCWRMCCAKCRVPWHAGVSCVEFQKLNKDERNTEDIMLMNLAKGKHWKRCPKCRIFVEKSEGCLFMLCRCGCRFCYKCGSHTPVDHRCSKCKC